MPRNAWITKPQARDIAILYDLYKYRILTTAQIKRLYFPNSKRYVDEKMRAMRNSRLIGTYTQRRPGRKGFAYHRILQKGLNLLKEKGYDIQYKPTDLTVSSGMRPYIIAANDIMTYVTPHGWRMKDSREVKHEYGLNHGDQIHGSLTSPEGTEYGLFVLEKDTLVKNLGKVAYEIKATSKKNVGLTNFLIFAKGQPSIDHFVEIANTEKRNSQGKPIQKKLRPSGSLCVLPLDYGVTYLNSRLSDKSYFESIFQQTKAPARWHAPSDKSRFEFIAEYKDKEVYVVNMLDTDLTKVDAIESYLIDRRRMARFKEATRDILVVTDERLLDYHRELIGTHRNVQYLSLTPEHMKKSVRDVVKPAYKRKGEDISIEKEEKNHRHHHQQIRAKFA